MSDSVKYYFEENFGKEKTEEYSQDVINIRELFRLLSFEDKVIAKRLLREESIF